MLNNGTRKVKNRFKKLIVFLTTLSAFCPWTKCWAVPVLLCVVSGLYIFSVLPKCLAFQCLWYAPSLCVAHMIWPTFFVVFNLSDNFSNVNFLLPVCLLNSSFQFFSVSLSLFLNIETHHKFQSPFCYNIAEQHFFPPLEYVVCNNNFQNNATCFTVYFVVIL